MKRCMTGRRRGAQRGQSSTEFIVLALVLVPLFLAVPLVGKYIDMMQTTEEASRYVAFEGVARNTRSPTSPWKSDTDLSTEVQRRFFSNSDAPVKTNDVAGDYYTYRNPVWTDHHGQPLIDKFSDDVGVKTQVTSETAIAAAEIYRGELKLSNSNMYNASVTVKPVNVADFFPFDAIDLSMTRRTVLLADAWTGFSRDDVRARIEGSFLMYPVGPAEALVDGLGDLPTLIFDPALVVGEFDWDIVPCDRLIGGC